MKLYKIFKHSQKDDEAVKQGWSWPGFFFGCVWALLKKQWVLGFSIIVSLLLLSLLTAPPGGEQGGYFSIMIVAFIISVILGNKGNQLREANLISRGYTHVDTITAENPQAAIAHYQKSADLATPVAN